MMLEVKKIEQLKHKYRIHINDKVYEILPIVMMKYHLSVGKFLSLSTLKDIINDNDYHYYDELAMKKLSKMMTKKALKTYLEEKNAPMNVVTKLMNHYEKMKFIDDYLYTKTYIETNQHKYGKPVLLEKLIALGIHENLAKSFIDNMNESHILKPYIEKKLKTTKGKNQQDVFNKTLRHFVAKGYDEATVFAIATSLKHFIQINDNDAIERQYQKMLQKYDKKYEEPELSYVIKQKLIKAGFQRDTIETLIKKDR